MTTKHFENFGNSEKNPAEKAENKRFSASFLTGFRQSLQKRHNAYECIFSSCNKVFKNYFRWKIHYNNHVNK